MSKTYKGESAAWFRIASAIICSLWLWVFLGPMEQLHLVNNATSFAIVFLGLPLAQMTPWRWLRVFAALVVSEVYIVHYYAGQVGLLQGVHGGQGDVLHGFLNVTTYEWNQALWLFHGVGNGLTDPLQTHLFLWCICGMYWLVAYASTKARLWVFYNVLAAIVLAIIEGNTPVHPNQALVIVLVLCVANLGLLQFKKLRGQLPRASVGAPAGRYFAPLLVLVAVSLTVALALPKDAPVWADPSKAIATWHGNGSSGTVQQMIGYQEVNDHLGGSFILNHAPAFSMISKYPTYLRGQVYQFYTGHGWQPGYQHYVPVPVGQPFAEYGLDASKVKGKVVKQNITVIGDVHAQTLLGGYAMQNVTLLPLPNGNVFEVAQDTDSVKVPGLTKGETYTVSSYEMQNPGEQLAKLPPLPSDRASAFPLAIREQYLQLPDIPDRVRKLANDLAGTKRSEYDIVNSVLNYLQSGGYVYETQGIPVPGPNQDYVDQFLFDSKKGYCNNFSSSMAVLLRSVGIPTRWVTGFATGEADPNYKGPDTKYSYLNSDAHSWVEVYFPNFGWIPFDPTPNFSMPYVPADTSSGSATPSNDGSTTPNTQKSKVPKDIPDPGAAAATAGPVTDWGHLIRTLLWAIAVAAVIVAAGLWVFRRRIREIKSKWVWREPTERSMLRGMQHLFRVLRKYGEVRKPGATLRDLQGIAESYGVDGSDYKHLVQTAESHWYGGKTPEAEDLRKARQTWIGWMVRIWRKGS